MTPLETIGISLSIAGSVGGIVLAYLTAVGEKRIRHLGFAGKLMCYPLIEVTLIGTLFGWWSGTSLIAVIVMNTVYMFTSYVGFVTTKED